MSNGWSVNVKTAGSSDIGSETYYVRVSDRRGAENTLRQLLGAGPTVCIEARLPVQSTVFDAIKVPVGHIRLQ
jgi:hypothetical protein